MIFSYYAILIIIIKYKNSALTVVATDDIVFVSILNRDVEHDNKYEYQILLHFLTWMTSYFN